VDRATNRPVRVTARNVEPNRGMLCVKGRFAYDFPVSPDRLKAPMIRRGGKDGELAEVSWDEALDFTAKRLAEIKAKHGADAIGAVSCARSTNENNYAAQKLLRAAVGTNNIDHCART